MNKPYNWPQRHRSRNVAAVGIGGAVLLAASWYALGAVGEGVRGVLDRDDRSHLEIISDEYQKLSEQERARFMGESFQALPTEYKRQVIGDDLGIKLGDLYQVR